MKYLIYMTAMLNLIGCSAQLKIDDASLKSDVTKARNSCECNDWAKLYINEQITILSEIKKLGKNHKDVTRLNEEYTMRAEKHYIYFNHCQPIYTKEGMGEKCEGYKELTEQDKKYSSLLKDLGMQ